MKIWTVIVVIVAAGGAAAAFALKADKTDPALLDEKLQHVVEREALVIEVVDTGKVQPGERVEIKSKVAGQVISVEVIEGASVRRGQVMLRLDPTDYEREVARAQAEVERADNALDFAKLDAERKRRALEHRGVAQIDVALAENEERARVIARKSARIALATVRDRLRYTRILAPIDGTVLEVGIEKGEVVTPGVQQTFEGRPLLTIGDLSTLLVRVELNQIDIARIVPKQSVTLTFDALPDRTFEARVSKIAPAAVKPEGQQVEVFPVEATLLDADPAIKPGMSADVRFRVATHPEVLTVPIEAVLKEDDKTFVTRIVKAPEGPTRAKTEVKLGVRNERVHQVLEGLSEGDKILIEPASAKDNEVEL